MLPRILSQRSISCSALAVKLSAWVSVGASVFLRTSPSLQHRVRPTDRARVEADFERLAGDVEAQTPIALELVLRIELVAGGFVREGRMAGLVLQHRRDLVPGHRRLEVDQRPVRAVRVDDLADRHPLRTPAAVPPAQRIDVDDDLDAEIDLAHPDQRAQPLERQGRVAFGVADDHQPAASLDQLVGAEVLEVAAVRHHQEARAERGAAEQLGEHVRQAEARRPLLGGGRIGAREPPAEAQVEHRQQEGHHRRRVVAHVRAGGGPRDGDGPAEADPARRAARQGRLDEADRPAAVLVRLTAAAARVGDVLVPVVAAGAERRQRERRALPRVQRQIAGAAEVQRAVENRQRPVQPDGFALVAHQQLAQGEVVQSRRSR